jgi:hypothetical protein
MHYGCCVNIKCMHSYKIAKCVYSTNPAYFTVESNLF